MYYRARLHDPRLQRFITEDPIGFEGGVNLYSYVGNSPVMVTDPLGLKPSPTFSPGPGIRGRGPWRGGLPGQLPRIVPAPPEPAVPPSPIAGRRPDRNGECDPGCYSRCLNNLGVCIAAVVTSWHTAVEVAVFAACAFSAGPAGVTACVEAYVATGLGRARLIYYTTAITACLTAYQVESTRCQPCER
jgi:hypothetical protein